jgi:hypothetical protein
MKNHAMTMYGGWRYSSTILNLDTNGGEWSASSPCRSIPGKQPLVPILGKGERGRRYRRVGESENSWEN